MLACAAALLCAAAQAAADGTELAVSTFSVYESQYENCEARIVTPMVTGIAVAGLQKEINSVLAEKALEVEGRYALEVIGMAGDPFASRGGPSGRTMDYAVIDGDERFLSLDVEERQIGGAAAAKHTIMNFDKATRLPITLEYFFNEKANCVKIISNAVQGEMRRANKKAKGSYWVAPKDDGGFSSIKANQNFYVDKEGRIVICFDKYEVAPGSAGCPQITLDMKELAPWLKAE